MLPYKVLCYVLGCRQPTVIGCRHRTFGRVVSCPGHNPIRHAYDVALVLESAGPPSQPPAADVDGGALVPRVPLTPVLPPFGEVRVLADW